LNGDQLLARALTAHDRHPRRGHTRPAGDQTAQRAICTPVDRRRGHARDENPVAHPHELVPMGASLQADGDLRSGHGAYDGPAPGPGAP